MHDQPASDTDIVYPSTAAFLSVHLACLAALITGVTRQALIVGIVLYWVRIFSIGAGYHRYFAHRSFKTSRLFQFCLGLLSQTSAQCGVLWWAEKHRQHHRYSDTDRDVHSPRRHGLLYAHVGGSLRLSTRKQTIGLCEISIAFLSCGGWTDIPICRRACWL
jgi:stearoyl-CoA desaturase (delta-9 desaturase)